MFRDSEAGAVAAVNGALAAGQQKEALAMLHTIKGTAGNLGAGQLFQAASELEAVVSIGDTRSTDALLDIFAHELETVLEALGALN